MRVIITGDRNWPEEGLEAALIGGVLDALFNVVNNDDLTIIQGGAKGADTVAKRWAEIPFAEEDHIYSETYMAPWKIYGKAAGVIRNQAMLDSGADLVIGFHSDIQNSKGTKDCLDRAKKMNIHTYLIGRY